MESLVSELGDILDMVSQLDACDTEHVPPLDIMTYGPTCDWRTDIAKIQNHGLELMACASEHEQGHYVVPKVIE